MAEIYLEKGHSEYHKSKKRRILKIIAALSFLLLTVFTRLPENIKVYGHSFFREVVKILSLLDTRNLASLESSHFIVKYPGAVDEADARLVLNTAEKFFSPVNNDLDFTTSKKIPIVIYSSKEKLNQFFGWPANESAMGVYWAGVIRVLSPKVWIEEEDKERQEDIFINSGPMAHEYTHFVVDYKTRGNYPRWFTEGLAQYEEFKLTGFRFTEPAGNLNQKLYSFDDLGKNFDYLPNQSLAYRQSFAAVKFLVDQYGETCVLEIINTLSRGKNIDYAIQNAAGMNMQTFEQEWLKWLSLNIGQFS
ncbi:peptidase MA family metallohydrolase [Desulfolucanica intricata]|uniref:peptidase MA family metallohydrolase n=1 Tax=Desulfolucanica intricata TaxID=1285191 RepID=UPI0009ED1147|nr:peptidase MA family metallohydrolase [Desulfolucanica intricata]